MSDDSSNTPTEWTPERIREARERCDKATPGPPAAPEVDDDDEPLPRGARVRTVPAKHLTALFSPSLHPHRRPNALGKVVRRMTSGDIYYDVRHDDGTVAGYERSELIDLSADASRPAVPSAADLRAITIDWPRTNARRGALMDREDAGTLTAEETAELADLQRLADLLIDKMYRDASRRGLTEEQAREMAREAILGANGGCAIVDRVAAALLRASRGELGPTKPGAQ